MGLRQAVGILVVALASAAGCGDADGGSGPSTSSNTGDGAASTVLPGTSLPSTPSIQPSVTTQLVAEVPVALDDIAGSRPLEEAGDVVYTGRFDDPDWGIQLDLDDGSVIGPAGFGVDAEGTVYVADGGRHRVITVDTGGNREVVELPEAVRREWVAGFAVGPDATIYLTLTDGLAVIRQGELVARLASDQLGWDGVYTSPSATEDGMWIQLPDTSWNLVVSPDGARVNDVHSAPDSQPGIDDDASVAVDAGAAGQLTFTRTPGGVKQSVVANSSPGGIGALVHTAIGDDLVAILAEVADPGSLIVLRVSPDGAVTGERLTIPEAGMVQNGIRLLVHGGDAYVEIGSLEGITVVRYSVPPNSAA